MKCFPLVGNEDQYLIYGTDYHGELVFDFVQSVDAPAKEFMKKFLSKHMSTK